MYELKELKQPLSYPSNDAFQTLSGFDKLINLPGIFIKQKFEAFEAVTGCETENKYVVYPTTEGGADHAKTVLFKAKEKSSTINRLCLSGNCRPFIVKVTNEPSDNLFLRFNRECACTCLCFNPPVMEVFLMEGQNEEGSFLGKIVRPWTCCDPELRVFDNRGNIIFFITSSGCQLGFLCKCPCDPCQIIDFEILDSFKNKIPGSKLQKRSSGCLKAAVSDTDNFSLIFPPNAKKEERSLLMATVIMLDFMLFEENPSQHKHNSNNNY